MNAYKFSLLIYFCFLQACNFQAKNKMSEFVESKERFAGDNFIDLSLSQNSYERLFSEFVEKGQEEHINKKTLKNYYFDYFVEQGPEGLLLRTNGLVLSLQVERGLATVHLKINRMLREPKNSSIYSRFDYSCRLRSFDTLKKIIDGVKPVLSLEEKDCKIYDSIKHPIKVAKDLLKSDVLGKRGIPKKIQLASIKPIAINRITSHEVRGQMYEDLTFHLEKTIYPKGVLGYRLFVDLSGAQKSKKFYNVFNYMQKSSLSYKRNFFQTEDLTFLISFAEKAEYENLIKTGNLTKKTGKTKI